MTRRLLLLLPSSTYRTDAFIAASRRLPDDVDVVTATDGDVTLPNEGPRGALSLPFSPVHDAVTALLTYAARHPLHAVVGVDDHAQLVAASVAAALGLPYSSPAAVAHTLDKLTQAHQLGAAGLPTPVTLHRAVLKPRAGRASQGVIRLPEEVVVQQYIPWSAEVAVEALLRDGAFQGLAIFDKPDPLEGPTFEETLYVTPSRLGRDAELYDVAARACAALGLTHGPVHVELRIDDQGAAWVIEVNPRSIGGRCSSALRFADPLTLDSLAPEELTLEDLILRSALSLPPPNKLTSTGAAAVAMLPVPSRGRLQSVEGLDAASQIEGVSSVEITIPISTSVVPLPDGDRYLGFITAFAPTPAAAEAAVRQACAAIGVTIASPPASSAPSI